MGGRGGYTDGKVGEGWMVIRPAARLSPSPHAVKGQDCRYLFVVFTAESCGTTRCCFQDLPYPNADSGRALSHWGPAGLCQRNP